MIRTCHHIQDDGVRCTNPAMYRRQVCFHHWRLLRPSAPVNDVAYVPPTFDCEASVSLVCSNILRSLFAGKITPKFAQSAMTCVRETAKSLRLQGKMGKPGERSETRLTPFMADYFNNLDQMQAQSAAAYPDPQPLIYPAHFADIPEDDDPEELSSRAPVSGGEGSASSAVEQPASATHGPDNLATGAPARAARAQLAVSAAAAAPSATDKKLSAHQSKLLKKILRHGPKHPQFHLAARLLDHHVSGGAS